MESRDSTGKFSVRNPYFFAVDSAGNQLPYIDTLRAIFFADKQVAILNMMQGKVDIGGRMMDPASFALYKQNEEVGGYGVREWQDTKTSRVIFMPNMNSMHPVKGPVLFDKRFRQALSLAINRQEINEFVFLGLATPAAVHGRPRRRVLRRSVDPVVRRLRPRRRPWPSSTKWA